MTFKNPREVYFSRLTIAMQMSHKISEVTGPKFTKYVAVVIFFIDGVNATIRVK